MPEVPLTRFQIKPWGTASDNIRFRRKLEIRASITDSDPQNARILKLVTDLGNTVLAKKAASDLHRYVQLLFVLHIRTLTSPQH